MQPPRCSVKCPYTLRSIVPIGSSGKISILAEAENESRGAAAKARPEIKNCLRSTRFMVTLCSALRNTLGTLRLDVGRLGQARREKCGHGREQGFIINERYQNQ